MKLNLNNKLLVIIALLGVIVFSLVKKPAVTNDDKTTFDNQVITEPTETFIINEEEPKKAVLSIQDITGVEGEQLKVPVRLIDDNKSFVSIEFTFYHDPEVMRITGVDKKDSLIEDWMVQTNNPIPSEFKISAASTKPIQKIGDLFYLEVELLSKGSTRIEYDAVFDEQQVDGRYSEVSVN